ncbi:hypothetical protein QEN19_002400 [Hanseniaspora menglaensis]
MKFQLIFTAAFLNTNKLISAHGVHSNSHDIEDILKHHTHSKNSVSDFFSFLTRNQENSSLFNKIYAKIDENYLASALTYNFIVCFALAAVFYAVPIKKIVSKIGAIFKRNYTKFLNNYGYLRDFEADDPTINSTSFNFVGAIMNSIKKNLFDDFDFENLFNFFMLAGFLKELFLELFYNVFVYSIGIASKKTRKSESFTVSSFISSFKHKESDSDIILKNVSSLAEKIMFSYIFFYILDRVINIILIKILKLDPEQAHSHSHASDHHDVATYLDDLNHKLSYQSDIKAVDIELDIDSSGRVLKSNSITTFDDGTLPEHEEYTDSDDEDYIVDDYDEDEEDSDFEIDDYEIEADVEKDLNNLDNLKFVILNIISDFILNINSGISLYNLFAKKKLSELKIFIIVWAIQYASHVFADSIYMLNKTKPSQFSLQLILSNLGVVVGILFKHLSQKQAPIMEQTTHVFVENNLKNYLINLFDIHNTYAENAVLQLESAKVKSKYWIVDTFYQYLNSLTAHNDSFDFEVFLLTFQIGFTMFLIFNKILPETRSPTNIKELLIAGTVAYLGYKSKV